MLIFCRCKQIPAPPSNGMIVVADTSHGSVGLFQCKGNKGLLTKDNVSHF